MWYSVADLEGAGGRPPPLQTQAYMVYYFEEKRMNNVTLQMLNFM